MKLRVLFLAAMLCALCAGQASALEYTMEAPDDYLFARPTSDETIYEWENPNVDRSKNTALIPPVFGSPTSYLPNPNVDRSKNTALIPPVFGSPTSYLPGSGTPLTPNLVPGALDGGLATQTGPVNYPTVSGGVSSTGSASSGYTEVTSDLYYANGSLGTLKIPAIGLSVKVYEGTGSATLAKGAGHFSNTSLKEQVTSPIPACGMGIAALRRTIEEQTITLVKSIPWNLGIRSPGPRSWAPAPTKSCLWKRSWRQIPAGQQPRQITG